MNVCWGEIRAHERFHHLRIGISQRQDVFLSLMRLVVARWWIGDSVLFAEKTVMELLTVGCFLFFEMVEKRMRVPQKEVNAWLPRKSEAF